MKIIPTDTKEENYSIEVDLEGVNYVLSFLWNERCEAWFMSLAYSTGVKLVSGVKLTTGTVLFSWFSTLDAPDGLLCVYDSSRSGEDPGLYDLGSDRRCQLVYVTLAEFRLILEDDGSFEDYVDELAE